MKTVYLVYRPVMDYEESMEAHLVCSTKRKAEKVRAEIVAFASALAEKMGNAFTEDGEPLSDEADMERSRRNEETVDAAQWPYGVCLSSDIPRYSRFNDGFDESSVAIMELRLL